MNLKTIVIGVLALVIISILGVSIFDITKPVPVIKVNVEVIEVDNKTIILESSAKQIQKTQLTRPITDLKSFPSISSHVLMSSGYSNWGHIEYKGPGEYEMLLGFKEGQNPKSNETVSVITYIYDINGEPLDRDVIDLVWE